MHSTAMVDDIPLREARFRRGEFGAKTLTRKGFAHAGLHQCVTVTLLLDAAPPAALRRIAPNDPHRRRNQMPRINKRDPLSTTTLIAGRVRPTTVRHRRCPGAAAVSG
jgi:hypothetical protein